MFVPFICGAAASEACCPDALRWWSTILLHPNSVLSHCRLRLPATISPRPVSILKVAPRSVLESSQLRGQRRTKRLHVPTYCHRSSKLDAAMVPRTLSKWLLVCHLNISQPALMSVLEISHQSTFTFLHTVYNPT